MIQARLLTGVLVGISVWVARPPALAAQLQAEAEVRDAVARALVALNAGDIDAYLSHFMPSARVLIQHDGDNSSPVELGPDEWRARLSKLAWPPGEIISQVLGGTAVTVVEVAGALPGPDGGTLLGLWRYAELRTRDEGTWRIAQLDISPRRMGLSVTLLDGSGQPMAARAEPPSVVADAPGSPAAVADSPGFPPAMVSPPGPPPAVPAAPEPPPRAGVAADQSVVVALPPGVPAAPAAPEVITRDDDGSATVRAVRLNAPLEVDGRLDEPVYSEVPPIGDFIQTLPDEGTPATELTEAWIMFDEDNVYVSARVHEEVPESQWTANEMRRDSNQIGNNDNFGVVFDTFYDRRNGYFFYTNPLGAMVDAQITNEGSPNFDWNPVWDVRTGRFDGGWTVEMRFPFKAFRYSPGTSQVWGLQVRRAIRRKNEWSHLTPVPRSAAGSSGRAAIMRLSRAATLAGIEAPPAGLSIDVKPYGIGHMTTDRSATPEVENELGGDGGVDLKWAITQNLAADFTYNTDFAQVEVDEQQINLTRYSLVFPEKREFFLESRGIFDFPARGAGGGGGGAGGGRGPGRGGAGGGAPSAFFSRRIGLQGGQLVPILGGGRLTGKIGPIGVGALNVQTDEVTEVDALGNESTVAELTNFTAVRLRADILGRSNIGALFTRRSRSLASEGWNHTYGADASFAFFEDLYIAGYYALTETPGLADLQERLGQSYQARVNYNADLEGFSASYLLVEDDFNPEVGFLRRSGFRQAQVSLRRSPRPSLEAIRQVRIQASADYVENARLGYVESRGISASVGIEFENSDQINLSYTDTYENLTQDERITGATIPAGRYPFGSAQASYSFGPQRFLSGNVSARYGTFYDGHLASAGISRGRIVVIPQLSLEPSVSYNWVDLPSETYNTTLAVTRVNFTFTPRMFLSALVQYNSSNDSFSANARLRWEYAPGSEIFLVYTEERDTSDFERFPVLSDRGLVLKVTRLLRF